MSFITTYCRLTNTTCSVNGEVVGKIDQVSEDSWFKQLYKQQGLAYPKFYKMDLLSQAGFLALEAMKKYNPALSSGYGDDEIGLVFANSSSSADTDSRFLASYREGGTPSPSLFVYTLPNIVLGELAIANKWYGESMFAILPAFEPAFFYTHTQLLMPASCEAVLCGWVEILEGNVDVLLFFVENKSDALFEYNQENVARLYAS